MARAVRVLVLPLLLAVFGSGCSAVLQGYVDARDDRTRSDEVWEDLESRIFVDATFKNEAFRREYVKEYARLFSMTEEQTAAMLEAELEEEKEQHVVMAAIYVAKASWEKIHPKHGIWDVRLENDEGQSLRATEVRQHDTDNPLWHRMYPLIAPHDEFYEIRFDRTLDDGSPLAVSGKPLHLIISGAPAQVKLTWSAP